MDLDEAQNDIRHYRTALESFEALIQSLQQTIVADAARLARLDPN